MALRIVNETLIREIDEMETDRIAVEEDLIVDVLVCGLCHKGFHFIDEFQEHKRERCKKISAYQNQNNKEKKKNLETSGFLLWKNSIAENKKIEKMYKLWGYLPIIVKYNWIQAAKIINTYDELAKTIPDKVIKIKPSSSNLTPNTEPSPFASSSHTELQPQQQSVNLPPCQTYHLPSNSLQNPAIKTVTLTQVELQP